jgi:predicted GNAT family N-acyltransferase
VPEDLEWDDLDPDCLHVVCELNGASVGTARMTADGRIGRMAVLSAARRHGVGRALLEALIAQARARGLSRTSLHAQVQAVPFYERMGFNPQGDPFMEAGIAHIEMRRRLVEVETMTDETGPAEAGDDEREFPDLSAYRLGETREEIFLHEADHSRAVIEQMTDQLRHRLYIISAELDPSVYNSRSYAEQLGRTVRLHRRAEVRILIRDNRRLVKQTHFLLGVIRQYSSQISVRRLRARSSSRAIVLADESGVLLRERDDLYRGTAFFHNPMLAKELHEEFKRLWDFSEPDPDLRQLSY